MTAEYATIVLAFAQGGCIANKLVRLVPSSEKAVALGKVVSMPETDFRAQTDADRA